MVTGTIVYIGRKEIYFLSVKEGLKFAYNHIKNHPTSKGISVGIYKKNSPPYWTVRYADVDRKKVIILDGGYPDYYLLNPNGSRGKKIYDDENYKRAWLNGAFTTKKA